MPCVTAVAVELNGTPGGLMLTNVPGVNCGAWAGRSSFPGAHLAGMKGGLPALPPLAEPPELLPAAAPPIAWAPETPALAVPPAAVLPAAVLPAAALPPAVPPPAPAIASTGPPGGLAPHASNSGKAQLK